MPTIKGTASVSDSRARQKALRKTKFPRNFDTKVILQKVNKPVLTQWIEQKVTSLLGFEDEIVASTVVNLFLPSDVTSPDAKKAQLDLVGFLGDEAATFSKQLWSLMLEAQACSSGIPQTLLEQKKKEMAERNQLQQQQQHYQLRPQNHHPQPVPLKINPNEKGASQRRRVNRFSRINQDRGDDNTTGSSNTNNTINHNNNNRNDDIDRNRRLPAAESSVPVCQTRLNRSTVDKDGTDRERTQLKDYKEDEGGNNANGEIVTDQFGRVIPKQRTDEKEDHAGSHADTSSSRRRNNRSRSRSRDRNINFRDLRRRPDNRDRDSDSVVNDDRRRYNDRRHHNYNHDHYDDRSHQRKGGRRHHDRDRDRYGYHYDNDCKIGDLQRRLAHLKKEYSGRDMNQQGNRSMHKIDAETTNEMNSIQERIHKLEQRRRRSLSASPRRSSRGHRRDRDRSHQRKNSRRRRSNSSSYSTNSNNSRSMESVECVDNNNDNVNDKGRLQDRSLSSDLIEGKKETRSKSKRHRRHRSRSGSSEVTGNK